jgi:hypothetical protein
MLLARILHHLNFKSSALQAAASRGPGFPFHLFLWNSMPVARELTETPAVGISLHTESAAANVNTLLNEAWFLEVGA